MKGNAVMMAKPLGLKESPGAAFGDLPGASRSSSLDQLYHGV